MNRCVWYLGIEKNKEDVVRVRLRPPVKSLGQILVLELQEGSDYARVVGVSARS